MQTPMTTLMTLIRLFQSQRRITILPITVIQSGIYSVNEDGETDSFTVVLNSEPISDVVIAISSDDTDESTVSLGH